MKIVLGATILTDDFRGYRIINKAQFRREIANQSKSRDYDKLYGVHLVTTLVKLLIRGTYQENFEPKYLQNYLDEYVFRFNRRKSRNIYKEFMRIVQHALRTPRITASETPVGLGYRRKRKPRNKIDFKHLSKQSYLSPTCVPNWFSERI